jgi:hypothetical protein
MSASSSSIRVSQSLSIPSQISGAGKHVAQVSGGSTLSMT